MCAAFLLAGVFASVNPARAAYVITDEDRFVQKLADFFHLSTDEVRAFMGVYTSSEQTEIHAKKRTFDDVYDNSKKVKLEFIDDKLCDAVDRGRLTREQRDAALEKIRGMMDTTPTAAEYQDMDGRVRRQAINRWKRDMDDWARDHGMTLAQLRELTGKGNKYLMGIYYD